ncbi:MAG: hypothetical protein RLZZ214_583 [Verrucomicrobiota bacterium]
MDHPRRRHLENHARNHPRGGHLLTRTRLYVSRRDTVLRSRIALIPFKIGEALPKITWDAAATSANLQWPGQNDTLDFSAPAGIIVLRDGAEILSSPTRP